MLDGVLTLSEYAEVVENCDFPLFGFDLRYVYCV